MAVGIEAIERTIGGHEPRMRQPIDEAREECGVDDQGQ